ncbi:hypothetical protein LXL04_003052 [Taraxacum kok-saghyz]
MIKPAPQQSDLKSNPQQPQSTKNDQQVFKKEIFVIKHRISHEIDRHEDEDDPTALNPSSIAGDGQSRNSGGSRSRTSSCTKEEVDAILIQCGRFSRSNSAGSQNPNRRRRYSRSNTSYDFDLDTSLKNDDGDDEAMNNHRQWSDGGRRGREARLPRVGMEKKTARWGLQKFGAVVATRKTQAGGGDGFRRRGETDENGSSDGNGSFRRVTGEIGRGKEGGRISDFVREWRRSAESNDSIISLSKNFKNIQEQIKNTQEHSRTMKNTQEQIKNTIAFRENISNLYNALGEESIWAAKRCQMGCLNLYPSPCIYTTRAALNKDK